MGELLNNLRKGSLFHRVESEGEGFSIIRTKADPDQFDMLVRELVDHAGQSYAAFPSTDPYHRSRYERVFILPID